MRKVLFRAGRPAEVVEAPVPVPGPGQLLVCTEAVGVGVGLVRMLEPGAAVRPGAEMVGTVAAAGPDVAGFEVGDRVGGVVFEDAYAEIVLADPRLVSHVPAEVDAAAALALVRGGLIALSALRAGRVARGESVLVTAAASGTGHLAVQLAKALGAARVVAAAGSADKADFARQCGADEVVTYSQPSWGDPVDLVLDGVGGELVQRGVDALAPFGRLVAFRVIFRLPGRSVPGQGVAAEAAHVVCQDAEVVDAQPLEHKLPQPGRVDLECALSLLAAGGSERGIGDPAVAR